jgi:RNA polymerase-binding transcription factor DksA
MSINPKIWTIDSLEKINRNSEKWITFVEWQKERILSRLQKYNNISTIKTQLDQTGDLSPYQKYKISTVSKYLLQSLDVINSGKYGICINCHQEIQVKRLLLVPAALYCVNCNNLKTTIQFLEK